MQRNRESLLYSHCNLLQCIFQVNKNSKYDPFSLQQVMCIKDKYWYFTFIATGYIVPPISKLPFLNIITDVLLMQVPAGATRCKY